MTAAAMDTLCLRHTRCQGVALLVLVTAGLSTPRRAGDRADYRRMSTAPLAVGTINSVILTDARLTPPTLVEALMIATEAKAAALQELGVTSPVSRRLGTDAIAVVSGQGTRVHDCGKHVLFGELLGQLVIEAVRGAATLAAGERGVSLTAGALFVTMAERSPRSPQGPVVGLW